MLSADEMKSLSNRSFLRLFVWSFQDVGDLASGIFSFVRAIAYEIDKIRVSQI
jgi:hypothetical protein